MYLKQFRPVIAFHGTTKNLAQSYLAGEPLQLSTKEWNWLGDGTYFWEASPQRAWDWARQLHDKNADVVGAVLDLGLCLDLGDIACTTELRSAYQGMSKLMRQQGIALPKNIAKQSGQPMNRQLDCAVINWLHNMRAIARQDALIVGDTDTAEQNQPFTTVRAHFYEGRPAFRGAALRQLTHIQICVVDQKAIKGIFRPRE